MSSGSVLSSVHSNVIPRSDKNLAATHARAARLRMVFRKSEARQHRLGIQRGEEAMI